MSHNPKKTSAFTTVDRGHRKTAQNVPCDDHITKLFFLFAYVIIIIKLYSHIQCALYDELECSLALTHIVPIYTIK